METYPPELVEAIVEKLIPPACREHVMGDLCERFESRSQYVLDAVATVPFVIASQVRRTFDIAVFLSEASALYIGFAGASLLSGPGFLYVHSTVLPSALVIAAMLMVFILRDAYTDRRNRSNREAALDLWLALAAAFASQGFIRLIHPQWLLPGWLLSLGIVIGAPMLFLLRRSVQNNRTDPAALAGAAAASLEELKRRAIWAHSRAWTLNWTWLALSLAVFYSTVKLVPRRFPSLNVLGLIVVVFVHAYRLHRGRFGSESRWISLSLRRQGDPYLNLLRSKRDGLLLFCGGDILKAVAPAVLLLLFLAFPLVFLVLGWFGGRPLPATFNPDEFTLSLAGFLIVCVFLFVLRAVNRRAAQALKREIDEPEKQERGKSRCAFSSVRASAFSQTRK